jgi:hypothetical protein
LDHDLAYSKKKGLIWLFAAAGVLVFALLGHFYLVPGIKMAKFSVYDRSGISSICDEMFGNTTFDDLLTEEIFLVAYDY